MRAKNAIFEHGSTENRAQSDYFVFRARTCPRILRKGVPHDAKPEKREEGERSTVVLNVYTVLKLFRLCVVVLLTSPVSSDRGAA